MSGGIDGTVIATTVGVEAAQRSEGVISMGIETQSISPPGGAERDRNDFARLRQARERNTGFAVGRYLQPAPMLFTRDGHNLFLGDMYRGQTAFLLCGGPSLTSHDLARLDQRGILTMAVNNAATVYRPHLWCSVDDPGNFSDAIWRDPAVQKFVPLCHMEKTFMIRDADDELIPSVDCVGDMPAVFGYRRNEDFNAEQWLFEDTFNWGNHSERVDADGNKGSRSVMYVALRLLYYLGVRRVYLLGCDFRMQHDRPNYAFDQDRTRAAVRGNNSSYRILNSRLARLQPHFEREGFEVLNCTPDSGLTVFAHRPFTEAVEAAASSVPQKIITAGMYDRQQREKEQSKNIREISNSDRQLEECLHKPEIADELTLVIPLKLAATDYFRLTWATWIKHRPWFRELPTLLLLDPSVERSQLPPSLAENSDTRLVTIDEGGGAPDSVNNSVQCPARHVETPWYLLLAPEAIAHRPLRWPLENWFEQNAENQQPVFIASSWGYTKPADIIEQLDEWADGVEGLSQHPRLELPYDPQIDRIHHDTISSWCFFGSTEWTREIAGYLQRGDWPPVAHSTFVNYCAARRQDPVLRVPMKSFGWDHSFSWTGHKIVDRCRALLSAEDLMTVKVAEPCLT